MPTLSQHPLQRQSENCHDSTLTCSCAFVLLRDGSKFYTVRDRACPVCGDDKLDWRGLAQMSGRMIASENVKLDCGDVIGRFGRIR